MTERDPAALRGVPSGPGLRESDLLARGARQAAIVAGVIAFCAVMGLAAIVVRPVIIIGAVAAIGGGDRDPRPAIPRTPPLHRGGLCSVPANSTRLSPS